MTEPHVYSAPNIRELALDTLNNRAEQRRNRRLINAIELNQTKRVKLAITVGKDAEKFAKLVTKAEDQLDKARDMMDKAEEALREATNLHNKMVLLEEELK